MLRWLIGKFKRPEPTQEPDYGPWIPFYGPNPRETLKGHYTEVINKVTDDALRVCERRDVLSARDEIIRSAFSQVIKSDIDSSQSLSEADCWNDLYIEHLDAVAEFKTQVYLEKTRQLRGFDYQSK